MEASNVTDIELENMVIKILKELSENYNSMKKDNEPIKSNQSEKNTTSEMNNTLEGINHRLDAENQISNLEDTVEKNTIRAGKNEDSLRKIWSNITTSASQGYQKEKRERERD